MSDKEAVRKRLLDAESFFDSAVASIQVTRGRLDACARRIRVLSDRRVVDPAKLRNPLHILRQAREEAQTGRELVMRRTIIHRGVQQPLPELVDKAAFADGLCLEVERLASELAAVSIRYAQFVDGLEAQLAAIAKHLDEPGSAT